MVNDCHTAFAVVWDNGVFCLELTRQIDLEFGLSFVHDHQIRVHTQAIGIAVAGIAGYYKAAGAAVALHSCIDRHGRKQDRVFHYFSHSFLALASSYMAR